MNVTFIGLLQVNVTFIGLLQVNVTFIGLLQVNLTFNIHGSHSHFGDKHQHSKETKRMYSISTSYQLSSLITETRRMKACGSLITETRRMKACGLHSHRFLLMGT